MPKRLNSAAVGALVRQARLSAGITQSELARRIGASRFWVAAFEKGKPSAEFGLALKAIEAAGLAFQVERESSGDRTPRPDSSRAGGHTPDLASVIAHVTLTRAAQSSVVGWPTAGALSSAKKARRQ